MIKITVERSRKNDESNDTNAFRGSYPMFDINKTSHHIIYMSFGILRRRSTIT